MDATWSRTASGGEWDAVVDLAHHIAAGGGLPEIQSPVVLDTGEVLHADVPLEGWRYQGLDVTYVEPRAVAIGGPLTFGLAAAGSAAARSRVRRDAEALAAPQWRPLGPLRVLATDRRLLVWHDNAWASVWYDAIRELHPSTEARHLELTFENDPPYSLSGAWAPYATVVLATALATRRGIDLTVVGSSSR